MFQANSIFMIGPYFLVKQICIQIDDVAVTLLLPNNMIELLYLVTLRYQNVRKCGAEKYP